jgi:threonine dehydrogenase-like Zn-dependent dehydrogenase
MRAVTWRGKRDVTVEDHPDPSIVAPTDAIIRVTSTAICGSDLHLYEVLTPFMRPGHILGHEPMGVVEEVGAEVRGLARGDRVVVPFNIACGSCWMCERQLFAQCETTQVRSHDKGAALFGYSELYGAVPGGQAEYLRVPFADVGPVVVPEGPPDDRFLYLSDVLPTAWQAIVFAEVPHGGTLAVLGLGPIGQAVVRLAPHLGVARVIGVDLVEERLQMAAQHGAEVVRLDGDEEVADVLRDLTDGRGPDSVIDAVGMEAHGSAMVRGVQHATTLLPDVLGAAVAERAGIDRLAALTSAIDTVRRGGTISLAGVYGGAVDPIPMLQLFDKGVTLRMGQCHVRRWMDDLLPLVLDDDDPLDTEGLATHHVPLEGAPEAYATFQQKRDGCIKVVLQP